MEVLKKKRLSEEIKGRRKHSKALSVSVFSSSPVRTEGHHRVIELNKRDLRVPLSTIPENSCRAGYHCTVKTSREGDGIRSNV